ncbi:pentapeptide repeat-containing protein [Cyanobacterium aponinum AL20118]|uniref:Pentapeptide repeat-containing protein n=1 Tax=Cyanobacterium aponinum AL20115 TaxID=3090662 RepID=A0AAF0ZCA9_9CHRO|nr:pentapeptide repeat-containing protein [Cyanobacterium aponinum]WPF87605.1 pentapeptide repeat-containing protein [Cyanobacterium aponinum AL20115]
MSDKKKESQPFLPKIVRRFQKTLSSFINAIAEAITSSVHIPEIAIGPIIGSLITAITTLIIGLVTISNIFSEQFLYRPLQIQDNNANYTLELARYQQTILTDYLNHATQLTLDYPLWKLQQNPYLLRSLTQTVLKEIDGERKRYIIMFLKDSFFLNSPSQEPRSLLKEADLTEANLSKLDLTASNFSGSNLSKANLSHTNFHKSNLKNANLNNANLTNADLRGANLSKIEATNTNFTNACYDVFTQFDSNFDPIKANMQQIDSFSNCPYIKDVSENSNKKSTKN